MTNESAFPNITHEELHFSMNKYNNVGGGNSCSNNNLQNNNLNNNNQNNFGSSGGSGMMFGNLLDESTSQFMMNVNNSTLGNITNTTMNNGGLP